MLEDQKTSLEVKLEQQYDTAQHLKELLAEERLATKGQANTRLEEILEGTAKKRKLEIRIDEMRGDLNTSLIEHH